MDRWRVGGARRGVYVFKRISKEIGKPADDHRGSNGSGAVTPSDTVVRCVTGGGGVIRRGGPRRKCGEGLGVRARRYCTYACV